MLVPLAHLLQPFLPKKHFRKGPSNSSVLCLSAHPMLLWWPCVDCQCLLLLGDHEANRKRLPSIAIILGFVCLTFSK